MSLLEGRCISDLPAPDTIADGLRGKMGDITWPIIKDHVDGCGRRPARGSGNLSKISFLRTSLLPCHPAGPLPPCAAPWHPLTASEETGTDSEGLASSLSRFLFRVVTVTEKEIVAAMKLIFERMKARSSLSASSQHIHTRTRRPECHQRAMNLSKRFRKSWQWS